MQARIENIIKTFTLIPSDYFNILYFFKSTLSFEFFWDFLPDRILPSAVLFSFYLSSFPATRSILHWCPFLWQHQPLPQSHVRPQLVCLSSVHNAPGPSFPTHCLLCQWKHNGWRGAWVRLFFFLTTLRQFLIIMFDINIGVWVSKMCWWYVGW